MYVPNIVFIWVPYIFLHITTKSETFNRITKCPGQNIIIQNDIELFTMDINGHLNIFKQKLFYTLDLEVNQIREIKINTSQVVSIILIYPIVFTFIIVKVNKVKKPWHRTKSKPDQSWTF